MARTVLRLVTFLDDLKHKIVILFIVSLLISGAFRLLAPPSRKADVNPDYAMQVASIRAGSAFLASDGAPLRRYPPLFPLLLAGTYEVAEALSLDKGTAVFVVSAVLIATAAIIVFVLARLFLAECTAFLAALLLASHPHILYGALMPLAETPFMVLLFGSLFFLLKALISRRGKGEYQQALGSGGLLGLSMLTKPIALFLPLLFVMSIVLWRQSPRYKRALFCGVFLTTVLLVVYPWEAFVYRKGQEVVLLSSGGVSSVRDGLLFNNVRFRDKLTLPKDVQQLSDEFSVRHQTFEGPRDIGRFLLEKLRENPRAVFLLVGVKTVRAWFGTDSQNPGLESMNKVLILLYMPAIIAGFAFYWRDRAADRALPRVVLMLVGYFWLMTILVLSIARYMVPVVGLLLIFVPYLLERYVRKIRGAGQGNETYALP